MYAPEHYQVEHPDYYKTEPVEAVHFRAIDGMPLCLYGDTESPVTKNPVEVNCLLCKEIYFD